MIGCSVAYHLSRLGMKQIVIVESGQIGCGTTWHAGKLVVVLQLLSRSAMSINLIPLMLLWCLPQPA